MVEGVQTKKEKIMAAKHKNFDLQNIAFLKKVRGRRCEIRK